MPGLICPLLGLQHLAPNSGDSVIGWWQQQATAYASAAAGYRRGMAILRWCCLLSPLLDALQGAQQPSVARDSTNGLDRR